MVPQILVTFPGEVSAEALEAIREFTAALAAAPAVETKERPNSVEVGSSAKGDIYCKSCKIYFGLDTTPEEVASQVTEIFRRVKERIAEV